MLFVLVALVATGIFIVTRSFILAPMIAGMVSERIGGRVSVGSAHLTGLRGAELRDVTIRTEHPGEPGEFVRAATVRVNVSLLDLLLGRADEIAIAFVEPWVRISEDAGNPNSFTFMTLGGGESDTGDETRLVVEVERGKVEVGTHRGAEFTPGGVISVAGTLHNQETAPNIFYFDFREVDQRGYAIGAGGVVIKGMLNVETFDTEASVDGLTFNDETLRLCPLQIQEWWQRLELDGHVDVFRMWVSARDGIRAQLIVEDIGLTIPLESPERVWSRYIGGRRAEPQGLPRMRVDRGELRFQDNVVELIDLSGVLTSNTAETGIAGVPYSVSGRIGPLPDFAWDERFEWSDRALAQTPLALSFAMRDFKYDGEAGGPNSVIELPRQVTQLFERFRVQSCTLESEVEVRREVVPGIAGAPPRSIFRTFGTATMRDGRGAYSNFPYPLENVRADVVFDQDVVRIDALVADGPHGGSLFMSGVVTPLDTKWPNVELDIQTTDVPLDETLREALPEHLARALETILHRPSFEQLRERGVVPDEAAVAAAQDDLQQLRAVREATLDAAELIVLDRKIEALERLIENGPFALGGSVDLELRVTRSEGRGEETNVGGTIHVRKAGLLLDHFPYPLYVRDQDLLLTHEGVRLDNIRARGAGGGEAIVDGSIMVVERDGTQAIEPNVTITAANDLVNPALVEAIALAGSAPEAGDHVDRSGRLIARDLLAAARLEGLLDVRGEITTRPGSPPWWHFNFALRGATATPDDSMSDAMRAAGLLWPDGFTVSDMVGEFTVTPEGLRLEALAGRRGPGKIEVTRGVLEFAGDLERALDIEFRGLTLEEYLLNLFPESTATRAREFWDAYHPRGTFSASLRYRANGETREPLELTVVPHEVSLDIGGEPISVRGVEESVTRISLSEDRVVFDDLSMSMESTDPEARSEDGRITLRGSFDRQRNGELGDFLFGGEVRAGRFESPWIREALVVVGAREWRDRLTDMDASGEFDLSFELKSQRETAERDFLAVVEPDAVAFTFNDVRIRAEVAPGSIAVIGNTGVDLIGISGETRAGAVFEIDGHVALGPPAVADLVVSYLGWPLEDEARAFLPDGLIAALKGVLFDTSELVRIDEADVRLERLAPGVEDSAGREWLPSFHGPVHIAGATVTTGITFSDIHGRVDVASAARLNAPPLVRMDVHADRGLARGRKVSDVDLTLVLSADGKNVLIPEGRAKMAGGVASVTGFAGVGEHDPYQVEVEVAAADLGELSTSYDSSAPEAKSVQISDSDGIVFAHFGIDGIKGRPEEKRGRASVRVVGGTLARNPITLPLMQLAQLMLPIDASLKYGEGELTIIGNFADIEHALLEGDRILFVGSGTVDIRDFTIDLILRSRGRVIGLSALVGALSDQIYAVRVSGPLHDTKARLIPVPAISQVLREDRRGSQTTTAVPTIKSRQ